MRKTSPKGRGRGRSNNRRSGGHNNNRVTNSFDSNGPGGRIRGSAQQVMDKYLSAARDATSNGDRVHAENCYQHADHYLRMHNVFMEKKAENEQRKSAQKANEEAAQIEEEEQPDITPAEMTASAEMPAPALSAS